uniref:Uncharacterized protein n=1 Tax=viral metagenome TaxID=1070528 RepID=A0A6M3IJB9_9ZZZZ
MSRAILLLLFLAGTAWGRSIPLPPPGHYSEKMHDSVAVSGSKIDTSYGAGVQLGGADMCGYVGCFTSRNDSINLVILADFSNDGIHWYETVPIDTIVVSGETDTTVAEAFEGYRDWLPFVRTRVKGAMTSTDTVDVQVWLVPLFLNRSRMF